MKQQRSQRLALMCLMILMILVSGCVATSGNFATLRHDEAVKQSFESFTAAQEYNYYYYGPISFPRAVVGISKQITLASKDWKPIHLTEKDLRRWIWGFAHRDPGGDLDRYGSNIVGSNGAFLGVWYSLEDWQQWARIELKGQDMLKIGRPINHRQNRRRFSQDQSGSG